MVDYDLVFKALLPFIVIGIVGVTFACIRFLPVFNTDFLKGDAT